MTASTRAGRVETFHRVCQAESLPPSIAWVEAYLKSSLPAEYQVLQWAIVKSDPQSREIHLEGSYLQG